MASSLMGHRCFGLSFISTFLSGWVEIQWDHGGANSYRMGAEGKYDLELSEDPASSPVPTPGEGEGEEDKESEEPPVELDEVCVCV